MIGSSIIHITLTQCAQRSAGVTAEQTSANTEGQSDENGSQHNQRLSIILASNINDGLQ